MVNQFLADYKQDVRDILVSILTEGPSYTLHGLCTALSPKLDELGLHPIYGEVLNLMAGWVHFSGIKDFPIPSTIVGLSPSAMYFHTRQLWTGNQLMYRRSLLRHMIHRLDTEY